MPEPILAPSDTWFTQGGTAVKRASITEIEIKDSYTPSDSVTASWDASAAKDSSVMVYVEGTKLTIAGNGSGKVYANPNSTAAFSSNGSDYFSFLTTFTGGNLLDTSKVTNMTDMFRLATNLITVDVSNWDTSNVTSLYRAFCGKSATPMALQTLDVSNWNTSNVTDMSGIFQYCSSLTSLDVSRWNTAACTSLNSMFKGCTSIENLNVSNWDVSNVMNFRNVFAGGNYGSPAFIADVDLSKWNTSSATDMSYMFYGYKGSNTLDVSNFDVSKVTAFNHTFAHSCLTITGYENWDTSSATDMNAMFYSVQNTTLDVSNFDVSNVTKFAQTFESCAATHIIGLEKWNTASANTFQQMFLNCGNLVSLDLSAFNTSTLEGISQMFRGCRKLTKIDGLDQWDTQNLKYPEYAFKDCANLTELDLSSWDTSKLFDNFCSVFEGCSSLKTIYVSDKWDLSHLKQYESEPDERLKNSFLGCTSLVGGAGTIYSADHVDYDYAIIDGKNGQPGSLTQKSDQPLLDAKRWVEYFKLCEAFPPDIAWVIWREQQKGGAG